MQLSTFLRTVLKIDAAACLGMAALVLPMTGPLERALGVGAAALGASAASLIPIGLFMLWLGTRRHAPAALVWLAVIGNLAWVLGSFAAAAELTGITPVGQFLIAGQGAAVLGLAIAEWMGLRASQSAELQAA